MEGEKQLCETVASLLGLIDDETLLVGWGIKRFDLPKLRLAFARNGLALPAFLAPRVCGDDEDQPMFDACCKFGRYFSRVGNDFTSLKRAAELLRIDGHKGVCDGSMAPVLHEEKRYAELATYCALDVLMEQQIFLRLTNYM